MRRILLMMVGKKQNNEYCNIYKRTWCNIKNFHYNPNNPNNQLPNKGVVVVNEVLAQQGGSPNSGQGNNHNNITHKRNMLHLYPTRSQSLRLS